MGIQVETLEQNELNHQNFIKSLDKNALMSMQSADSVNLHEV